MFYWKLIALFVSVSATWASDISMLDLMNACKRSQVCTIIDAEALQSCQVDTDYVDVLKRSNAASDLGSGISSDIVGKERKDLLEQLENNPRVNEKVVGAELGKTGANVPGYVPTPTDFETVRKRQIIYATDELESSSMSSGDEELVESSTIFINTSPDTGDEELEMVEEDEMEASTYSAHAEVRKPIRGKRSTVMESFIRKPIGGNKIYGDGVFQKENYRRQELYDDESFISKKYQRAESIMTDRFSDVLYYGGFKYHSSCLPFPVQNKVYYPDLGSCKRFFQLHKYSGKFTLSNCPDKPTPALKEVCDWGVLVCSRNYECNHSIYREFQ